MDLDPPFPVVTCPGCRQPMDVVATEVMANGQNMTTYRCESCGAETGRMHKRDARARQQGA